MGKVKDYRDGLKEWLSKPRAQDNEPDDPRRDCPWKCRKDDPECVCTGSRGQQVGK